MPLSSFTPRARNLKSRSSGISALTTWLHVSNLWHGSQTVGPRSQTGFSQVAVSRNGWGINSLVFLRAGLAAHAKLAVYDDPLERRALGWPAFIAGRSGGHGAALPDLLVPSLCSCSTPGT